MDGANRASWALIIAKYWYIICSWCAAYVIDLFLEDIGKMAFFKEIWDQGKAVVI